MPSGNQTARDRRPAESFAAWVDAHKPSLRVQFALAFGVAALLLVLLIRWVDAKSPTADQPVVSSENVLQREEQEGDAVVGQDQAPHVVRVAAGTATAATLEAAVLRFMHAQVANGVISGPITHSGCVAAAGGTAARGVYRCAVVAGSVTYPFDGVVEPVARTVTYCKVDAAPIAGQTIPVSVRCR